MRIGASVGVAITTPQAPSDPIDTEDLLRRADRALYRAKTEGGSTVARATAGSTAAASPNPPAACADEDEHPDHTSTRSIQ